MSSLGRLPGPKESAFSLEALLQLAERTFKELLLVGLERGASKLCGPFQLPGEGGLHFGPQAVRTYPEHRRLANEMNPEGGALEPVLPLDLYGLRQFHHLEVEPQSSSGVGLDDIGPDKAGLTGGTFKRFHPNYSRPPLSEVSGVREVPEDRFGLQFNLYLPCGAWQGATSGVCESTKVPDQKGLLELTHGRGDLLQGLDRLLAPGRVS